MKYFAAMVFGVVLCGGSVLANEPNAFPYDEFVKFIEKVPAEKIDGAEAVAAYLKAAKPEDRLDAAKANFRIQTADGKTIALRCDVLPAKAAEGATAVDQKKIAGGFTHKLWIPKDAAKYSGAMVLNDLPAGFLEVQFPLPPQQGPVPVPGK